MANLTDVQKKNLEKSGYKIIERGGKTSIEMQSSSGTVRYILENGGLLRIDSYFGDVKDENAHDRLSVDSDGKISGHGYGHSKW